MVILALDSGIERTGYAFFEKADESERLLSYGCVTTSKHDSMATRLHDLQTQFVKLFADCTPHEIVMEQLFFSKNTSTAIAVAQSQGVILALAGGSGIPVAFLSPMTIKQSLTGYGKADKKQVEKMVLLMLGMKEAPRPDDTVDAIACGLTYCTMKKFQTMTL